MIWSVLRTQVKKRCLLGTGTKHDEQATTAMNAAGDLLHSVKWGCLRGSLELGIASGETAATGEISTVGIVDTNHIIIKPAFKVIDGTVESIVMAPPATSGRPKKFVFHNGAYHFGCPTADGAYVAVLPYWKKFIAPAENSTPEIVSYLGDAIFIAAAVWQFAKYFESEEETGVKSSDALPELLICARAAQSRNSWQGPSLEEIIRQRK